MSEARVPFFRFFFEDIEQGALQMTFIMRFSAAHDADKFFILLSIVTSLSSALLMVVQTLPQMRDWLWHRVLSKCPWLGQTGLGRCIAGMILFGLYRFTATYPWLAACSDP